MPFDQGFCDLVYRSVKNLLSNRYGSSSVETCFDQEKRPRIDSNDGYPSPGLLVPDNPRTSAYGPASGQEQAFT
ncbi:hypothetical protein SEA_KEELAN_75 [Gordonia phage Keelan]|nr:hypothetical protein SEA_KEELAN_75 [Gordonia phage Keelan]